MIYNKATLIAVAFLPDYRVVSTRISFFLKKKVWANNKTPSF
ncbi:protein of unknown function [Maridesulfovibrio hydrothermalis AM13 = DSM 14728]|uniref:Uncharacterized protein n=1 Tax=Maridesulfovibrio hydrothermalis AM13 = DSM 14728 TaxID=1121451 RepID=L0RAP9_9BACT|nr:protein of unknown function [Maridesulfovibrio hydrothermalis AM13 = DSM 14728]